MPIISAFPTGSNTDETEQLIREHNNSADAHKGLFKETNAAATAAKTAADKAQSDLAEHAGKTDNPHGVTATQVGALPLTGGTLTGNLTGKYISGTWLQATEDNHMKNTSAKVAVLDGSGWVYYRTVSEMFADLNIPGAVKTALDEAKAYTDSAIGDAIAASY